MNNEDIFQEILMEGLEDWVPVDRVIGLTRESKESQGEDFKAATVEVIESLLGRELIVVGEIGETGFEAWTGDIGDIVAKVVAKLDRVNWAPFGGVCWLANTPRGDSEVSG
ncbi:MAG TPA: hypothetical protein VGP70_17635 [Actinomadura sp.]|jgi:hypothetical protein|nr:hypothetical protein [Actinomadura sp.]